MTLAPSIVSTRSGLSFLQQRLLYASNHCSSPLVFAENVPQRADDRERFTTAAGEVRSYGDSVGGAALLERLQSRETQKYGPRLTGDRLMLTHGASGGLALVIDWLRMRYSDFLIHAPALRSITELAVASGYAVRLEADIDRLIEKLAVASARPAVVYLCSPANPSGTLITGESWHQLTALAMNRGHMLLVDQVYDDFVYGATVSSPLGTGCGPEHYFCFNSFSKNYAAPGLRIGWLAAAPSAIATLTSRWERAGICVAGPSQAIACSLLESGNAALIQEIRERRAQILSWVQRHTEQIAPAAAGLQTILPLAVGTAEAFADRLLEKHGLVVTTSANYAGTAQDFIRIPFGYSPRVAARALELIALELDTCFQSKEYFISAHSDTA